MLRFTLSAALATLVATAAHAQSIPPGPPGPSPTPRLEELATISGLSAAQQVEVHKILIERRDAHEALATKQRAELDALRTKGRNEHERIDEQSAERLRKQLGEEAYGRFAAWQIGHHRGIARDGGPHSPLPSRPERMDGRPHDDAKRPAPASPDADAEAGS